MLTSITLVVNSIDSNLLVGAQYCPQREQEVRQVVNLGRQLSIVTVVETKAIDNISVCGLISASHTNVVHCEAQEKVGWLVGWLVG